MLSATLRLFVLRHGKSDWSTGDPDFDRPLADRGRASAQRVGIWMSEEGLLPDRVISSPARRARDTAELACRMLELKESRIHFDERIYGGSIGELLASLAEHASEAQQVLLVGHNSGPGFGRASRISGAGAACRIGRRKSTADCCARRASPIDRLAISWARKRQADFAYPARCDAPMTASELFTCFVTHGQRGLERVRKQFF